MLNRFAMVLGTLAVVSLAAAEERWTLETSVRRALDAAPEVRMADAEVAIRAGEYRQADAWPNPVVDVSASNRLALEEGTDGSDLTRAAITQSLPLARLARERRVASANIDAAQGNRRVARLDIEQRTAQAFHVLQLMSVHLKLARERQAVAQSYTARGKDRIVRYLTPAERLRLEILHARADQALASAEGEWGEALGRFRALLALSPTTELTVAELAPPPPPPPLDVLLAALDRHAAIVAARAEHTAASASVDAARARRFSDPALTLFRERDVIGGARRDINGIGLTVQIPLWNHNDGGIATAQARADAADAKRAARARGLEADVRQAHAHFRHLIEQAEHFRVNVLEPSRKLFTVTRRGFNAGEGNVLTLVDAHDGYFQAQSRYGELLVDAAREAAALRAATGQSILEAQP